MQVSDITNRRAFTLTELLVVIGVIGVMLAILLPAIQLMRESANRTTCANNLNQIGVALNLFANQHRSFPSNGGWDGQQTIDDVNGMPITVWTTVDASNRKINWGVGDPTRSVADQTGPWTYSILPYLDQQNIYQERRWDRPVSMYGCPSRRPNIAIIAQDDQYSWSFGGSWTWAHCDYAGNRFLFPNRPNVILPNQIANGASNTILVGEKVMDPRSYVSGSWYWDEPYFIGGADASARHGLQNIQDAVGVNVMQNWGSAHPSSSRFLFADGSTRDLDYGVAPDVLQALLSQNDNVVREP